MKKKPKKVTSKKADILFSKWIRERDKRCVRCGRQDLLQCSHFWSRSHSAVRYNVDNCDTLCYPCHYGNSKGWEYEKNGDYMEFKKKQLGMKKYEKLKKLAQSTIKRQDVIDLCINFLSQKEKNHD